jgi:hypothetical protein
MWSVLHGDRTGAPQPHQEKPADVVQQCVAVVQGASP